MSDQRKKLSTCRDTITMQSTWTDFAVAQSDDRDPIDFIHPKPISMAALCKTTQCNASAGLNKYTSTFSNQITMAMILFGRK